MTHYITMNYFVSHCNFHISTALQKAKQEDRWKLERIFTTHVLYKSNGNRTLTVLYQFADVCMDYMLL